MLPQSTAEHYRQQQRLTLATLTATRRAWAQMGADFDASWRQVGPRLLTVATAAQLGAVRQGIAYVPAVLAETNQTADPAGNIVESALVGDAADGRSLDGLLYGAVTQAKTAAGQSQSPADALARGGRWLDMAVSTLVSDAARDTVGLGIVSRPRLNGYVRMLNPPSCARCAILAGKWFRWNEGFARHPRCDCRHIPSSEDRAGDFRTDPQKAFRSGQVRGLSKADTQAIEDGADVSQVVNASRGMYEARVFGRDIKATREGTTLRGAAGKRLSDQGLERVPGSRYRTARSPRLRPETIYEMAEDRADALRLLKRFGYLT